MPSDNSVSGYDTPPVESTWFPDWVRLVEEITNQENPVKNFRPNLMADCVICTRPLDISITVPKGDDLRLPVHKRQTEISAVLPCGHLIGYCCVQEDPSALCPFCRQDKRCKKCGISLLARCSGWSGGLAEDVPLTAGRDRDGSAEKHYCKTCLTEQAAGVLTTTFIGTESCPLCKEGSPHARPDETVEEHRARRARAADSFLHNRLQLFADLKWPNFGCIRLRNPQAFTYVKDHERDKRTEFFYMYRDSLIKKLKPRIFGDCPFTGDAAGPVTPEVICYLTVLSSRHTALERESSERYANIWHSAMDKEMAVDTTKPAVVDLPADPEEWPIPQDPLSYL